MNRFIPAMFFCIVVLWTSLSVAAPTSVGEIAAIRGPAEAVGADQIRRPLAFKGQIFSDDVIVTGQKARLQVMFRDNTIISMGADSEIKIEEYSLAERGGTIKTNVKEGVFHIMGGSIAKESPENFVTETPVATIGIRGSMFAFTLKNKQLSIVFLGGKGIDIFNSAGNVAITNPGFGTIVTDFKSIPETPRNFADDELQNILQMSKPGENADVKSDETKPGGSSQSVKPKDGMSQAGIKPADSKPSGPQEQKPMLPPLQLPRPPVLQQLGPKPSTPGVLGVMNTDPLPFNTVHNIVNTNTENILNTAVQTEQRIMAKGRQQNFTDIAGSTDPSTLYSDIGIVEAYLYKDHASGFVQNNKGEKTGFELPLPPRDVSAPYTGFQKLENVPGKRVIDGLEETPDNMSMGYSSTGTFLIFGMDDFSYFRDPDRFFYSEIAFAGVKALQERRPINGISVFKGPAIGYAEFGAMGNQESNAGNGDMKLMANWHNNKIFGFANNMGEPDKVVAGEDIQTEKGSPVIVLGDINPDIPVIENALAFGYYRPEITIPIETQSDGSASVGNSYDLSLSGYSPIVWVQGELKGEFYGSQFDGVGFLSGGKLVMLQGDQLNPSGGYSITSAGFRNPETAPSKTGTTRLQGFAFGISENMDRPDRDSRYFMNSLPEDFTIAVNRDEGTLDGVLRANDIKGSGAALSDVRIGGSNMSAYINDENFAAMIDGPNSVKSPDGTVLGLKPNGNYLVTDLAERKLADYTSWGYWELSYDETTGDVKTPYHLHQPGSMWVAGEMTPESKMNDLRQTGFKGLYEGKAMGVWTAAPGTITDVHQIGNLEGTSRMQVDFSPSAVSQLAGDINFADKGILLKFQSERIAGTAFHANITNSQGGNVNGAFYGPNADSVAGSFGAKLQDGNIMGVFGAGIKRAP
ncbi:FecR domain-containing protein [Desulforegula conservatrix]|uniref:FecR domain-containing protein n=1 Tax=Desulforegula conservatrix TaxID=153026 RepID=UPI00040B0C12|nr:FecR domain-containing protein [Desulforegula conservatrix]